MLKKVSKDLFSLSLPSSSTSFPPLPVAEAEIEGKRVSQTEKRVFIWRDVRVLTKPGVPLRSQWPSSPSLAKLDLGARSRSTSVEESPTLLINDEKLPLRVG